MTDFIVTITDPAQLAGITWAREAYNKTLPPPNPEPPPMDEENVITPLAEPKSMAIDTDDEYVQWIMETAAASYAVQQEQEAWIKAYQDSQSAGTRGTITPPAFRG